ncbi:MAG TPA: Co2+/Mg2+ efflux protein ApaG [Myxococcales bacterium]|nr:Co2+/Mg2+ efflux protein ApaG [Deltaproteobacteria bacterium]MBU48209.1 Co2+/Mg2+ efflux protein ApaG [Deltaproteobacteria bacterium]HAA53992.1 Co2+/Mg2+ efflux protein ApaG [Myxococcales bacterium]|tara:strand:- start:10724 stop:11104 length:381 start_codon:yes stop_codon:yes gene_type:complete
MSDVTTRGIRIQVASQFLDEHSKTDEGVWLFSYHVTIENVGEEPAQLINRHWIITDGWDKVEEVKGPGVIGEQPYLTPGESFEYTSYCPLPTPTGTMHGSYEMRLDTGEMFHAEVGTFHLKEPGLQ